MSGKKKRYVVIPDDNVFNDKMETTSFSVFRDMHLKLYSRSHTPVVMASLSHGAESGDSPPTRPPGRFMQTEAGRVQLLDSLDLNEATLVSMTADQATTFARRYPGLRIRPEVILYPLRCGASSLVRKEAKPSSFRSAKTLVLQCIDSVTGAPIADADLVVVLNRCKGVGITNVRTDAQGSFTTVLPARQKVIDAIICVPLAGYWGAQVEAIQIAATGATNIQLNVVPISQGFKDAVDLMLNAATPASGTGVKVAVIDAGTSRAAGLNIVTGLNTTGTEPADEWFDNGSGHGTHVAGIISRIAPAAEIHVYRVFEKGAEGASEFAIARAIRQAVDDGCDLINLSLGQSTEPISMSREIRRARAFGTVCIAATGNDYMSPVSYPARSNPVVAVSACGSLNSWPTGAMTGRSVADVPKPVGNAFFARFSNIGPEVDFIGPGVGIISWVSDKARGVMDGTSMACPAVTGLFARLLSSQAGLLNANRDQQRSDDIIKFANLNASPLGFGADYEGCGLIR
ncbi:S8 family serine peptidase [Sinorhizobium meliloti]|uniref:S8 family serine peptidase n=1 Tax=Rhizobium meliloti TaxID=382 RepID=UPI000426E75A|nr:S8 family serine peptidase [Sinorhizobium meliloti]MDE4618399.1 S8 family serine peptidase [Sinorhizobium meliloti]